MRLLKELCTARGRVDETLGQGGVAQDEGGYLPFQGLVTIHLFF